MQDATGHYLKKKHKEKKTVVCIKFGVDSKMFNSTYMYYTQPLTCKSTSWFIAFWIESPP